MKEEDIYRNRKDRRQELNKKEERNSKKKLRGRK